MIRHSVILQLKSSLHSSEKQSFFDAVQKLAKIPNVHKFEVLNQISPKNKFEYGISMEFKDSAEYDFYSNHPEHIDFIQNFWLKSVEDYLEIDFTHF